MDRHKEGRRGPHEMRGVIAQRILAAARVSFAEHGYQATSMRSIAQRAGVDPALVKYYFDDKAGLFEASLVPPAGYIDAIAAAAAAPMPTRGAALVRVMLASWDDPETEEFLRSIILCAAQEQIAMERLRDSFATYILDAVSASLSDEERRLRASLASSQIAGLAMTRYIWKVGALATIPSSQVVSLIAPAVQHYLAGELGTEGSSTCHAAQH